MYAQNGSMYVFEFWLLSRHRKTVRLDFIFAPETMAIDSKFKQVSMHIFFLGNEKRPLRVSRNCRDGQVLSDVIIMIARDLTVIASV